MMKTALTSMAIILVAATVLTAATAFAADENKRYPLEKQVSQSVQLTSQALLWLKIRAVRGQRFVSRKLR